MFIIVNGLVISIAIIAPLVPCHKYINNCFFFFLPHTVVVAAACVCLVCFFFIYRAHFAFFLFTNLLQQEVTKDNRPKGLKNAAAAMSLRIFTAFFVHTD